VDTTLFPKIKFEVKCSKGTYVRSLAHDFGQKLSLGGTLIELRRIFSGDLSITDAKSVEEWLEIIDAAEVTEDVSK